jgi:amino-acid N-acetyltransferase
LANVLPSESLTFQNRLNGVIQIDDASPADFDLVCALLEEHGLPVAGLREHFDHAIVARLDGEVVGSAELEVHSDGALLRSVAVAPRLTGRGVGHNLVEAILKRAADERIAAVYLLTQTAADFFPRFAFQRISRAEVPPGVRTSIEFTSACPSSAVVMRRQIGQAEQSG